MQAIFRGSYIFQILYTIVRCDAVDMVYLMPYRRKGANESSHHETVNGAMRFTAVTMQNDANIPIFSGVDANQSGFGFPAIAPRGNSANIPKIADLVYSLKPDNWFPSFHAIILTRQDSECYV
jgi:hypothetical protein